MRESNCPYEKEVRRAALESRWSRAVRDHARSCRDCKELSLVLSGMQTLAAEPAEPPALPDPYLVWLKAQLLERQASFDQHSQPFVLLEWLAQAAVPACLALWLVWKWSAVETALSSWFYSAGSAGVFDGWRTATDLLSFSSPLAGWAVAAVFSFAFLLLLEPLWAD